MSAPKAAKEMFPKRVHSRRWSKVWQFFSLFLLGILLIQYMNLSRSPVRFLYSSEPNAVAYIDPLPASALTATRSRDNGDLKKAVPKSKVLITDDDIWTNKPEVNIVVISGRDVEGTLSLSQEGFAAGIDEVGPIYTPEELLTPNTTWDYKLNALESDKIPLNRDLPDFRRRKCRDIVYQEETMPNMTIIIPIYNEAASLLLRTLYAIFMRTPQFLIDEVIVVDDCSTHSNLLEPLERYLYALDRKITLVRNRQREGLIRARQVGADMATGEVLVFLDSHTEPTIGWYQPLLALVMEHPNWLLQPSSLKTDSETMEMGHAQYDHDPSLMKRPARTVFSWDLRVLWLPVPREQQSEKPFPVSALIGCYIIVRRDFFYQIGAYDTAMEVWGGENSELAFRAWLCGGAAMTQPCSRIGHVFRRLPYIDEAGVKMSVRRNLARIAEVWMEGYTDLFYRSHWTRRRLPVLTDQDWAAVAKRKALRDRMQCKSFDYLLKTVVPDIPVPPSNVVYFGNFKAPFFYNHGCLVARSKVEFSEGGCASKAVVPEHTFYISPQGQLVHAGPYKCLFPKGVEDKLSLGNCDHQAGHWSAENFPTELQSFKGLVLYQIMYNEGNKTLCLSRGIKSKSIAVRSVPVELTACASSAKYQGWDISYVFSGPRNASEAARASLLQSPDIWAEESDM